MSNLTYGHIGKPPQADRCRRGSSDIKYYPQDAKAMYAACPSAHKQLVLLPGTDDGAEFVTYSVADQGRAVLEKFSTDFAGS
jgi:hypothetical protein